MKRACLLLLVGCTGFAQELVHWTMASDASKAPPGSTVILKLTAKIDPGWHMYSLTATPADGPNATTIALAENPAIESVAVYQPEAEKGLGDAGLGRGSRRAGASCVYRPSRIWAFRREPTALWWSRPRRGGF